MSVRALPTMYDLPVSWDGQRVTWGEWRTVWSSVDFHVPVSEVACRSCGLLATPLRNLGVVDPLPGAVAESEVVRSLPSGRRYRQPVTVTARSVLALFATRCTGCGHDQVHDERTGELWDLDESDYTGQGSTVEGVLW